ncbi:MAG: protoheme IX farnesyltransferase [Armatimonadota bacterium]
MSVAIEPPPAKAAAARESFGVVSRFSDYWALTKPRVTLLVWISMFAGMAMGSMSIGGGIPLFTWLSALVGGYLVIGCANSLNQAFEASRDSRMRRTADRPVPAGRVTREEAIGVGIALGLAGALTLSVFVNPLTALLGVASIMLYAFGYTPLKPRTHLCTLVGAVPGAIPPLAGWAAATGEVGPASLLLFAVQFLWQFPHFWAIAWLNRGDYRRAGFKMLPFPDAAGRRTGLQCLRYSLALIPVAVGFAAFVTHVVAYVVVSAGLGVWLSLASARFMSSASDEDARRLLRVTILYLPLMLLLMVLSLR